MSSRREGFTLIELLLVLVLGAIILGAAVETLIRQDEAYTFYNAKTEAQQDTRTGIDLLAAEIRELSSTGADLIMATPDSMRFRALRKFGLLCDKDKWAKRLVVAQLGMEPFESGDSILVYVDGDTLMARDDEWQVDYVQNTSTSIACATTLGINLAGLMPSADLIQLTTGMALRYDSVYPGAPVRSFETLTYRKATWNSVDLLARIQNGAVAPLVGPLAAADGFVLQYYDAFGNELTSFPLSAADRAAVARIRVRLNAVRRIGGGETYNDVLTTDVYLRGA